MDAEYGQIAGEFMRGAAPISDRFRVLEILVAVLEPLSLQVTLMRSSPL